MRGVVVAVALSAMVGALQANEADAPPGEVRNSVESGRQLPTSSPAASHGDAEGARRNGRKSADFSAENIVPDICTGC